MKQKFEKGSPEWQMFADFFRIAEEYWIAETADEYWDELIRELNKFCMKYNKIPLASKLANCFSNTKEREMGYRKE